MVYVTGFFKDKCIKLVYHSKVYDKSLFCSVYYGGKYFGFGSFHIRYLYKDIHLYEKNFLDDVMKNGVII